MTRREFEQAASLREELAVLKSGRNQNPRTEDLERLLKEAESLPDRSWVTVQADIAVEKHPLYHGKDGPVLTARMVEPAPPAAQEVVTF